MTRTLAASAPRVLSMLALCALSAGAAPAVQDETAVLTVLRSREAVRFAVNAASRQMGATVDGRWRDGEWWTAQIPTHRRTSGAGAADLLAYVRVAFSGNPPDSVRATFTAVVWSTVESMGDERSTTAHALLTDIVQRTDRILTAGAPPE